ncbi:MAG: FtsX-like permease family protein [Ruminiclostridium sp.]|nr:FtsX-like permease family protein [Ruminiclostridium sp.]
MKKALAKSAVREIKNTKNRFFSIFGIVAIGVGLFSGVKASAPDMRITADKYYDDTNLMNFRLVSTYGFDEKDIEAIKGLKGAEVYPSYYTDVIASAEGSTPEASRVIAFSENNSNLNTITLTEGRLPENAGECIISASDMNGSWLPMGTKVVFTDGDGENPDDMLSRNEFTIVGSFISSLYVDKTSYGSTSVGNGSIDSVYYIPEENFCVEYNTEVYLRFPELDGLICYNDEYKDKIEAITEEIEAVADNRKEGRYEDIIKEANETLEEAKQELADAEKEANEEIADGEKELEDARKKLEDAEKEIADGEQELLDGEKELLDAREELDNAYIELADGRAEYEKEIADAEQKIADGEKEIAENQQKLMDGEKEYNDGLKEFNEGYEKFLEGKKEYEDGLAEYEKGRAELDEKLAEWEKGYAEYESGLKLLEDSKAELDGAEAQINQLKMLYGESNPVYIAAKMQYDEGLAAYNAGLTELETAKVQLDEGKALLDEGLAQLDEAKAQLDEAKELIDENEKTINEAKAELDKAKEEIEDGKRQLEEGRQTLEDSKKELEQAKIDAEKEFADAEQKLADGEIEYEKGLKELEDGRKELEDGKKEYEDGLKEFKDGEKELEDGKAEAEEKIADAKEELADAEQEIADLEKPEWYIFTRDDNAGYSEYGENANRINNIAAVFPVFFILVAALVCLTTMSRMVEEQRTQIGTLKALGYTNREIILKYVFYAALATFTGALTGVLVGMQLFPIVIILAYGMMYNIPELCTPIDIPVALGSILACLAAIILTVFFTCKSALSEQAAQLMRPKAPKVGKRILLERITPLWKHFNFSNKVTARNLFRYKRKLLMSTVGIAGCTALLLTGFALYDSVNDIIALQYGEIQFYDGIVVYDGEKYPDADDKTTELLSPYGGTVSVYQKQMGVNANGKSVDAYIAVPSDPVAFSQFFTLRDRKTGEKYSLNDGDIYIDEKMSMLLDNVNGGDTLVINKSDTEEIPVKLTAYFENYPGHFVYMTEKTYVELFGEVPEYNALYFSHNLSEEEEDGLAEEILKTEGVLTVSFTSDMKAGYVTMLETLSYVIIVIIVAAGALAYIVMYNLTNINITERIREIATLKVLGFYDGEVDSYIFRENILLTILGTLAGLVLGVFLATFVITTAEVDLVMFGRNIYLRSYLLAAVFTLAFSVLVTLVMHKRLKEVNMIEALKSVE